MDENELFKQMCIEDEVKYEDELDKTFEYLECKALYEEGMWCQ